MELKLFRHLWGADPDWQKFFPRIRELGYSGIETRHPGGEKAEWFENLLKNHEFSYIAQIFTNGNTVSEHLKSFESQILEVQSLRPRLINCHSGYDGWDESDAESFFKQALDIEQKYQIQVAHETHRGRVLYNPWVTSRLLKKFGNLKLCCDFSHWVVVCERLLHSEAALIQQCAERCIHLHARVGYEEGPQVPDPSAPEYQPHLIAHETWWTWIWESQHRRGLDETTLTPEFGPPGYLHTLPHTNVPVADLWSICNWQSERQKENFLKWWKGRKAV